MWTRKPSVVAGLIAAVGAFALLGNPDATLAASWNNAAGDLWETPANWTGSVPPSISQSVAINLDGSYTVLITNSTADSFPSTMTMDTLSMANSAADAMYLTINYTNPAVTFLVTNTGVNALRIGSGAGSSPVFELLSGNVNVQGGVKIGNAAGGQGTLHLKGGSFSVNGSGTSGLSVGALAGSTGTVVVAGGSLYVTNATSFFGVAYQNAASGTLIVSNGLFATSGGTFAVGRTLGNGKLLVHGGEVHLNSNVTIGDTSGSTGSVVVTGGKIVATNFTGTGASFFVVGNTGLGGMVVSNTGLFSVNRLSLGHGSGGIGHLLVTQGGRLEMTGANYLRAGGLSSAGTGGISNVNGGTVQFTIDNPALSFGPGTGTGFVINSTIEFKGVNAANLAGNVSTFFTYAGTNTLRLITATNQMLSAYNLQTDGSTAFSVLDLVSNSVFQATNLLVGSGASVIGTGTLLANNVTNLGTIAPGHSPGTLAFTSNLTLGASSVLDLEIGGTNAVDYDRVLVDGALTRDGAFNLSFLSFTPVGGEVFDLLDFGSASGSFSAINLPTLTGGLLWDQSQFDSQGILSILNPIPEPSTATLIGLLGASWIILRRRKA